MPLPSEYQSVIMNVTATIAASGTTSAAVDIGGTTLLGIQLPAAFTGTAISFQAATSLGGVYQTVIDGSGTTLSKTVAQGRYLILDPSEFAGFQFLKIVSGSTEAAQRDLVLVCRPV